MATERGSCFFFDRQQQGGRELAIDRSIEARSIDPIDRVLVVFCVSCFAPAALLHPPPPPPPPPAATGTLCLSRQAQGKIEIDEAAAASSASEKFGFGIKRMMGRRDLSSPNHLNNNKEEEARVID
jgi:hypothetical protein